jgi:hypothetical protein
MERRTPDLSAGGAQKGSGVPLSPEEQRILQDIEKSFYEHDPEFAHEVSSTTLYKVAGRNLKWLTLGFIVGLVILVASFVWSLFLAFFGFVIMLACAFFFERNLRRMGKAGWASFSSSMGSGGLGGSLGNASKRVRDRFRRSE